MKKRLALLVIIPWWSASALPSLSQLAEDIANIRGSLAALTNLSDRVEGRLATATNLAARMEAAWNSTGAGRLALHGKPSHRYETNEVTRIIQRVEVHPDGYEYVVPGSRVRALTPEEAAEAAALRKDAAAQRIQRLRESIEKWDAAGAAPAADDQAVISAAKARINAAKARKTLERLLARQETNTVTVTVTPQGGGGGGR